MRLIIAAVGRLKKGPEQDLVARYCERISTVGPPLGFSKLDRLEIPESRASNDQARQLEEETALLSKLPDRCRLNLFDERGQTFDSRKFAHGLATMRDDGVTSLAFIIGGPDGLSQSFRDRSDSIISFGKLTIPHQIARILVAEQIYRSLTILSGHPYHRD